MPHAGHAVVEQFLISHNSAISACEKGAEWQRALGLLATLGHAAVERNTISYNSAITACERGAEWQRALGLLAPMGQAAVERFTISYNSAISACDNSAEWQRALGAACDNGTCSSGEEHNQLQFGHQCLRLRGRMLLAVISESLA